MRRTRGFTLVEIMIVVGIIAVLAAIAIPNLLRARANANEAAALSALKALCTAAISFRAVSTTYPSSLISLSSITPPYIDSTLGGGVKQGYSFSLSGGGANTFSATARPQTYQTTGTRSFFVDESGVVKFTTTSNAATASDAPLQ